MGFKVNLENLLKQKSTSTNVQCCCSYYNLQNINFSTAKYLECNNIDRITNIKCKQTIARKILGTTFFYRNKDCRYGSKIVLDLICL